MVYQTYFWSGVALIAGLSLCGCDGSSPVGETGGSAGSTAQGGSGGAGGQTEPDPLAYLNAKAGTYEGSWSLSGLDADGQTALVYQWTDIALANQPTVESTRAYLHVEDTLTFTFGFMGTQKQNWLEGVLLHPDGTFGNQFVEQDGVVTLLVEVEPNHFEYQTSLSMYDLALVEGLTKDNLIEGHHTITKVITYPNGVETHTITRETHVEYADSTNATVIQNFESLTGEHKKTM
ncbi:MAG: hypothetical protein IPK82_11335 [Polyangiaceae bacterium]|nr:hypothetical protein [Polyangiaceae bacterium]